MQFTFAKNHWILSTHSNTTSKNVSWPHFSWPTLYMLLITLCSLRDDICFRVFHKMAPLVPTTSRARRLVIIYKPYNSADEERKTTMSMWCDIALNFGILLNMLACRYGVQRRRRDCYQRRGVHGDPEGQGPQERLPGTLRRTAKHQGRSSVLSEVGRPVQATTDPR